MSRDDVLVDAHRAATDDLDRVERDVTELGVDVEVVRIEQGSDPADALVRVAEERDASVIVIGLRHRSPVGKLIMGSAAQRILLDARCPVLAVKEDTGVSDLDRRPVGRARRRRCSPARCSCATTAAARRSRA